MSRLASLACYCRVVETIFYSCLVLFGKEFLVVMSLLHNILCIRKKEVIEKLVVIILRVSKTIED